MTSNFISEKRLILFGMVIRRFESSRDSSVAESEVSFVVKLVYFSFFKKETSLCFLGTTTLNCESNVRHAVSKLYDVHDLDFTPSSVSSNMSPINA